MFNPTIVEMINVLADLYDNGIGYSGIGTARSALSVFISVCAKKSMDISNNFFVKKFMKWVFKKWLESRNSFKLPKIITASIIFDSSFTETMYSIIVNICPTWTDLHLVSVSAIEFADS